MMRLWIGVVTLAAYAVSLLATLAALAMGAFFAYMVGSNMGDAIVAIWQTLMLYIFIPNAILAFISIFSLNSKLAARNWAYFVTFAGILMVLNFMTFPHKLGQAYFCYWLVYALAMASIRFYPAPPKEIVDAEPKAGDQETQQPGADQAAPSR